MTASKLDLLIVCTIVLSAGSFSPRPTFALDPSLDISQYAHTAWKVRDGFVKGALTSIAQTPDGYLWVGTEFGLYRFDGVRAVLWQPPAGQQLPGDIVSVLLSAQDGTLWIGTGNGLASWKGGKLAQVPELANQIVTSLLQARDGTVWITTNAGPGGKLCDIRSGAVHCDALAAVMKALYEDSKGAIWVGLQNGVWRWEPGSPEFFSLPNEPNGIISLAEDEQGHLLIGSHAGILRLVNGRFEPYLSPRSRYPWQVTRIFRDHDGALWVGTSEHGLVHISERGRTDVFSSLDGLSGDHVRRFLEDQEGSIWVATLDGLDRFRGYAIPTISGKQGLSSTSAWSVLASRDGSVWIANSSALNHWKNGQLSLFGSRGGTQKSDGKLNRRPPTSLFQDNSGRIWVSNNNGEVGYLQDDRFVRTVGLPGGQVYSMAEVPPGNLWIANEQAGLFQLFEGRVLRQVPWAEFGREGFAKTIVADPSERGLWLGFHRGGVAYFADGKIRSSYSAANGLAEGQVTDLRFGARGALWAATSNGLSRIKDGHIITLTRKNGLPCNEVVATIEDDDHGMWLNLTCGLVRITQAELDAWVADPSRIVSTKLFDTYDGVRTHAAAGGYQPLMTKSADGKIWFLPWDGVSIINPHHLPYNKIPPPVHIEQIVADRKTYWQSSYGDAASSPSRLPPLARDLTIDYTALSLVVPEKVHFRYKLEGWDRDWQDAGTRRQAFYTNLAPRNYRFRVIACNNSGVWNEAGTFLDFSIAPAYWQTNWFRVLCVAAFMTILWAAYRLRVGVLEERQAILGRHQAVLERHQAEISALNQRLMKAQEEERIRIAGELHDGVLQKLTSLALKLGTASLDLPADSEPKAEVREVEKELIRVGTEIRQLSHELHPAVLQEAGLPSALQSYCEEFSSTRGIPVSYQGDESVEELSPGAALCIYRIAQEALGNVAKHAKARQVEVRLTRSDSRVCLVVSDDGVGFNPDGSGKSGGLGLINMRERVRQLNGTFAFESQPGRGTTVKAEVPFRPAP